MPVFILTMILEGSLSFLFYTDEERSPERLSHLRQGHTAGIGLQPMSFPRFQRSEATDCPTDLFLPGWQGHGIPGGRRRAELGAESGRTPKDSMGTRTIFHEAHGPCPRVVLLFH